MENILTPEIQLVPELVDTERGDAGFGHTGINLIEEMGKDFIGIEQIWPYEGLGIDRGEERMTLCVGKSHFLKPLEQRLICLPFRVVGMARCNLQVAMQIKGLVCGIVVTKNGHLKLNVLNTLDQVVPLTPHTRAIHVFGMHLGFRRLGEKWKGIVSAIEVSKSWADGMDIEEAAQFIGKYLQDRYWNVGDLSEHPITKKMERFRVTHKRIVWRGSGGEGLRTPLVYDKVADREKV